MVNQYINVRGKLIDLSKPMVMGILNVTPDSFYIDSRKETDKAIVERARQIVEEGGSMIDIGAFSTRPGAKVVSVEDEMERLKHGLALVRNAVGSDVVVSVDTYRPKVARYCIEEWSADMINDVSEGGRTGIVNQPIHEEESMFAMVAKLQVPYILMSVQANMHNMLIEFARDLQQLTALGAKDIILDPGLGFGKTLEENYQIMQQLDKLQVLDMPILVGLSRKSMLYRLLGGDATTMLNATTAMNMVALQRGTAILRVHDVAEAVEVCRLYQQLTCS